MHFRPWSSRLLEYFRYWLWSLCTAKRVIFFYSYSVHHFYMPYLLFVVTSSLYFLNNYFRTKLCYVYLRFMKCMKFHADSKSFLQGNCGLWTQLHLNKMTSGHRYKNYFLSTNLSSVKMKAGLNLIKRLKYVFCTS